MAFQFRAEDVVRLEEFETDDGNDDNDVIRVVGRSNLVITSQTGSVVSGGFPSRSDLTIFDETLGEEIFVDEIYFVRVSVRDGGATRTGTFALFSDFVGAGALDYRTWAVLVDGEPLPDFAPGTDIIPRVVGVDDLSDGSVGPYRGGATVPLAGFTSVERLPDIGGIPETFPTPSAPFLPSPVVSETLDADPAGGRLVGDPALNTRINGSAADDVLVDLGGDNSILAGGGLNRVTTGAGDDEISGGDARDVVKSGAGDDFVATFGGNDAILAGAGADVVDAGDGDDVIKPGEGDDYVDAGPGNDRVLAGGGDDTVLGGEGDDVILPGRGNDYLLGGAGNDVIRGFRGDEILLGGEGDDTLLGGLEDDTLEGGAGNDRLGGGPGRDAFIFRDGDFGDDRIVDFRIGSDVLDFRGSGLSFAAFTLTQSGGNAVVSIDGASGTLVLGGVDAAALEAAALDSFLF